MTSRQQHPNDRILEIDIVRGFALGGVIVVNVLQFAYPALYYGSLETPGAGQLNRIVEAGVRLGAEGAFVTMFAFLFGLGFGMHSSAGSNNETVTFRRRLLALLAIGIAHGTLLWIGDILALFAVSATALFVLSRWSNRQVGAAVALGFGLSLVLFTVQAYSAQEPPPHAVLAEAVEVYRGGDFIAITEQRAREFLGGLPAQVVRWGPQIAAIFLLGACAARMGIHDFERTGDRFYRSCARLMFAVGLPIKAAYALTFIEPEIGSLHSAILRALAIGLGGPALGLAYMATLYRLLQRSRVRRALAPLASVGRASLSNYILQSLVCTTIFYGYGFGLFNRFGAAFAVPLALAVFALQIPLSAAWLLRFRYGPLEWCVRRYARRASPA